MLEDGAITPIPKGLRPRVLDYMCETVQHPRERRILHSGQHFSIGVEASQLLVELTDGRFFDQREELQGFAPHPFETYTLSMWVGDHKGMSECLLIVDPMKNGDMGASMVTMRWEDDEPTQAGSSATMIGRQDAMSFNLGPETGERTNAYAGAKAAWMFIDVFRLLLSRPGVVSIGAAQPRRHSLRKGKRTAYYSASAITFDIDKAKRVMTTTSTGRGKIMPGYRYRAHLCHSGGDRSCIHKWQAVGGHMDEQEIWQPDAEDGKANATWHCVNCGRHRWHRRAGQRGDTSVGYVKQTYRIKRGSDDFVPANSKET